MTEDLRNVAEVVSIIGRSVGDSPWDPQDRRGALLEGHLGLAIQMLVQSYLMRLRTEIELPQGRVSVGSDVDLNFRTLELNRTSSDPNDRTSGGRDWPMGPYAWPRNYQGILEQVTRISGS